MIIACINLNSQQTRVGFEPMLRLSPLSYSPLTKLLIFDILQHNRKLLMDINPPASDVPVSTGVNCEILSYKWLFISIGLQSIFTKQTIGSIWAKKHFTNLFFIENQGLKYNFSFYFVHFRIGLKNEARAKTCSFGL